MVLVNKKDPVQLAFVDGECSVEEESDIYATKLGGLPVWFAKPSDDQRAHIHDNWLTCKTCGLRKHLILQAFCPVQSVGETKDLDRVVYIFACNRRECSKTSWTVLRSMSCRPDSKKVDDDVPNEKNSKKFDFFQDSSDWNETESIDVADLTDLLATAKVNSNQEVENRDDSNLEDQSFHDNLVDPNPLPSLYLYTEDEPEDGKNEEDKLLRHAKELLDLYKESEAKLDILRSQAQVSPEWSDESYEKSMFEDKTFFAFQAKTQLNPSQCVRYKWLNEKPLFYDKDTVSDRIPCCELCGASRKHEMQLMPAILLELPLEQKARNDVNSNSDRNEKSVFETVGLEFGCVHIYTCSRNCNIKQQKLFQGSNLLLCQEYALVELEKQ